MKTVAVGKDLVAVAYWGGTAQVVADDGQVRTAQLLPHDVTGLAWLDGKLVVGLSDGEVMRWPCNERLLVETSREPLAISGSQRDHLASGV